MVIRKQLIDIDDLIEVIRSGFCSCEICSPNPKANILDLFIEIQDKDNDLCHTDCTLLKKESGQCSLYLNKNLVVTTHGYCRCERCKKYFGNGDKNEK